MVVPHAKTVRELYYIAPVENLKSIFDNGILSHNKVKGKSVAQIYNPEIVKRRKHLMEKVFGIMPIFILTLETPCSLKLSVKKLWRM